jgi:hypothetical protein
VPTKSGRKGREKLVDDDDDDDDFDVPTRTDGPATRGAPPPDAPEAGLDFEFDYGFLVEEGQDEEYTDVESKRVRTDKNQSAPLRPEDDPALSHPPRPSRGNTNVGKAPKGQRPQISGGGASGAGAAAGVIGGTGQTRNPARRDAVTPQPMPAPATQGQPKSGRISPTTALLRAFAHKREQIGLTVAQLQQLTGIAEAELARMETAPAGYRLPYDHAVVLARALGVSPREMPGLRLKNDIEGFRLDDVHRWLLNGPKMTFEGDSGERFSGDIERSAVTQSFAVQIGDSSLGDAWPAGTMLGFVMGAEYRPNDVVIIRSRRTKAMWLRRARPPSYIGLAPWQPPFAATGGEWTVIARLAVILAV